MKKYFLFSILLLQSFLLSVQAQLLVYDSFSTKPKEFVILNSKGYFQIEKSDTIFHNSDSEFSRTFKIDIKDNLHYILINRNGQSFFYPLIKGNQYLSFKSDTSNFFETDNIYFNTFSKIEKLSREFVAKYQLPKGKLSKKILNELPNFNNELIDIIKNHEFSNELNYTFIRFFNYSVYNKLLSKKELKKKVSFFLNKLNLEPVFFNIWGYNHYLNNLLDDYFTYNMGIRNMPFRTYKREPLIEFVFKNDLFTNIDLNHYLSYYKIRQLESVNDKNLLFYLADSLRNMVQNPILKEELAVYLGKSETRVKPLAKAPNFFLKEVGKNQVYRLNDLNDKLVVLDFWATWCGPCVRSFKTLKKLNHTYGDSVNFVSIGSDELEDKAIKFLEKNPEYTWKFLHDGKNGATGLIYEAYSIPKYVIIDLNGVIVLETHEISVVEQYLKEHFKY